jgi:tryptophan 2,3-dioxygenase
MHPKYQRRIFFPELWTSQELKDWGEQNLEGHEILTNFETIEI